MASTLTLERIKGIVLSTLRDLSERADLQAAHRHCRQRPGVAALIDTKRRPAS